VELWRVVEVWRWDGQGMDIAESEIGARYFWTVFAEF
jgi:hypothetical protein